MTRHEIETDLRRVRDEIQDLEAEEDELEEALLRLTKSNDPDAEIEIGPVCAICEALVPNYEIKCCSECARRIGIMLQYGKTPEQMAGRKAELIPIIRAAAKELPTPAEFCEVVA